MKPFRRVRVLIVIVVLVLLGMSIGMRGAQADGPIVKTNNLAGWVEGNMPVTPAGTGTAREAPSGGRPARPAAAVGG